MKRLREIRQFVWLAAQAVWYRDSQAMVCLVIEAADHMTTRDLQEAADYLLAIKEATQRKSGGQTRAAGS